MTGFALAVLAAVGALTVWGAVDYARQARRWRAVPGPGQHQRRCPSIAPEGSLRCVLGDDHTGRHLGLDGGPDAFVPYRWDGTWYPGGW